MKRGIVTITDFSTLIIWVVMLPCFFFIYSSLACAAEPSFLADKHKNAGMNCESCHGENPPSKPVPMQACLGCHGEDYAKLAGQTKKVAPNPHDSHLENAPCEFCHHAHKPSEYYCAKCHILDSKVP